MTSFCCWFLVILIVLIVVGIWCSICFYKKNEDLDRVERMVEIINKLDLGRLNKCADINLNKEDIEIHIDENTIFKISKSDAERKNYKTFTKK